MRGLRSSAPDRASPRFGRQEDVIAGGLMAFGALWLGWSREAAGSCREGLAMRLLHRLRSLAVLALIAISVSACGYNVIPTKQEAANAAWAEVQNPYQRRADLVPN